MIVWQGVALFIAGMLAGALNSVAGGGSFISFPTLLLVGVPAVPANATNAAAVLPGSIASIPPYRRDLAHEKREVLVFSLVSALGGVAGALLLARTPQTLFERMIPFLLFLATIIFAAGGRITTLFRRLSGRSKHTQDDQPRGNRGGAFVAVLAIQFVIALYGGFFGGGIGIMMLAGFALLGLTDIHAMNALKVVLASVINGVAVVAFIVLRLIYWPQMIVMAVGAIVGGWAGARLAHEVPQNGIRWFVITVGVGLSIYYFIHYLVLK
ncbi:MAG TPA: sulfite exporter TauE/SafE family protein [Ktedonobacterales bacterium]